MDKDKATQKSDQYGVITSITFNDPNAHPCNKCKYGSKHTGNDCEVHIFSHCIDNLKDDEYYIELPDETSP